MKRRKDKPREPGIRIVNGKRIDLKAKRARRLSAATAVPVADTPEQKRARRTARISSAEQEARRVSRLKAKDGGKDGTTLAAISLRITRSRSEKRMIRCRPGSFEWRYGRNSQDAHYHAGSQFARLWESAGIAVASSANFLRGITSGYTGGISDGRVAAIDRLRVLAKGDNDNAGLGHESMERLIAYCVEGRLVAEIAKASQTPARDMAAVLHQDLRALAKQLRYG